MLGESLPCERLLEGKFHRVGLRPVLGRRSALSEIAKDAARRGQLTDISNLSTQAGGGAARDVQSTVATYQSPLARQQVSLQERQLDAYIQELALKRESQQPDYWGTALASIGQGAGQMAGYGFSKMLFS